MADQGSIGISHSGPGRRTDSGWPTTTAVVARFKTDTIYFVPGWGWWSTPSPLARLPLFARQLLAVWWTATAGISIGQPRGRNGASSLSGTVTVGGSPAARRVVIIDRKSLEVVAVTFSAADGTWSVSGLDPSDSERYAALCFFGDGAENAAIFDRLTPG